MYYIYILHSLNKDKFYIGQTENVQKRLYEHNHPLVNSKFTAKYFPWELSLYFSVNDKRADVIKVEKFIKNQKSRNFIMKLIANKENPGFFETLVNNVIYVG